MAAPVKTYVVLENNIESDRNEPYSYFVFPSMRELRNCKEINEYSIVYSTVDQLKEAYTEEELLSVMEASYNKLKSPLDNETTGYLRAQGVHGEFFSYVDFVARKYKPIKKETKVSAEVVNIEPTAPIKTEPKAQRTARSKYDPDAKIVVTGDNPYREGSNRWHNFEALAKSATVADALAAMKALTPGGNSVDIRLALEKGAIKLGG
jgi:hypothetical protein